MFYSNANDKIVTDPESGEIICSNCGMVLSDKVEDTSHLERRVFREGQIDETRSRTGPPTSLASHDMGLATIVGKDDRDAISGKPYTNKGQIMNPPAVSR
jgi:transcription initiation factor TFIIB